MYGCGPLGSLTAHSGTLQTLSVPTGRFTYVSGQSGAHDAVFRRILGDPAHAAAELRAVLPAALVERLDLDRLARVSASFVDASLRWRHSDLLFTVGLDGGEAFVYVLVEHQSGTDPLTPSRRLASICRVSGSFSMIWPVWTIRLCGTGR